LSRLEPVVGLRSKGGADIGNDRIRLLEAIDTYGSLSAAARNVGLIYKAVWDAVAAINNSPMAIVARDIAACIGACFPRRPTPA
jgi:molybdenum-dependent DNA-binding transcriptional regulator ModE